MLYQELPEIESTPLDGWGRWLAPALIVGAAVTAALVALLSARPLIAAALVVLGIIGAAVAYFRQREARSPIQSVVLGPDYALLGSALGLINDPVALTTGEGSLLLVNAAYRERFGGARPPHQLATSEEARQGLELAQTMAWRDGAGCVAAIETEAGP